jgi:predicted nucleotidyltransferase
MYRINDIAFDEYKVKSVELELETCDLTLKVEFTKDNDRITQEKHYVFNTNCDVNINQIIEKLKKIINE